MATWNELLNDLQRQGGPAVDAWYVDHLEQSLAEISSLRGGRNVMLYGSGFLQKPAVPAPHVIMMPEDLNGIMAAFAGMDWDKGLTVVLHTPGGVTSAAQTMVEYVRSKFASVEVIVPAFAMSAGTMFSLASDLIVMGNQSQLGPIDPQLQMNGQQHSARAIVEQFAQARKEIVGDPDTGAAGDPAAGHVWAPILGSMGPALVQYAQDQLDFSERMVAGWLELYMMARDAEPAASGRRIAKYFNDASNHKSHDKRIGIDEARSQGVKVEKLEDSQPLQEAVLTLYHVLTILIEQTPTTKIITSGSGRNWVKSWVGSTP